MKRALILGGVLLGLGALSAPLEAQSAIARGKVVDSQGQGVPGATVLVEFQGEIPRKSELKTNKRGEYMQGGLYPGLYRFTASKEGYHPTYLDERVASGTPTQIPDIMLKTTDEVAKAEGRATTETSKKFAEAVALVSAEKFDEAEAKFKEIVAETPKVPEAYQNLAYVYARKEDWKNAEASFLKALELRPGDTNLTAGLAAIYTQTGRQSEADALMSRTVAEHPGDATVQFNRAIYLVNAGKVDEAIAEFEAVLRTDPAMATAHFHLGTLLVGQGKIPQAIEHLEKYLSMNPDNKENVATAKKLIASLKK
jgi:Flp pilus assembly protein TadD